MTSQKQLAANRLNAQKSTGPRTDEGKARSAQNARKHGLFVADSVLLQEDQQEFADLLAAFHSEYGPLTPVENHLVNQLALAVLKQNRYTRMETGTLWDSQPRATRIQATESIAVTAWSKRFPIILRAQAHASREFFRIYRALEARRMTSRDQRALSPKIEIAVGLRNEPRPAEPQQPKLRNEPISAPNPNKIIELPQTSEIGPSVIRVYPRASVANKPTRKDPKVA